MSAFRPIQLALIATAASAMLAGPVSAANQPWRVEILAPRVVASGCANVISTTARGAVQRCLAKAGVTPLPFEDFVATANAVCKTTHVATSVVTPTLVGFVYSIRLSSILKPACA